MSQFIEMFKGDNQVPLGDICNIEKGATITRNDVLPGEVPVVAGGQEPSCYHNVANREAGAITVSASGAYAGYINFWNCPIFASDCNTIISKDDEKTDQTFVYFGLRAMQKQIYGLQKGGAQPHVYGKDLQKFMFPCPSYAKQIEFSKMAKQADKSEFVGCKSQFFEMFEGDEYPLIKLGDYTDLTWGDTNTTKNSYVTEGYLAYSASGPDGKLDHYDYDCEGIVLSAIGADCGKTWFASGKWSCIKNTIRFWSTFDDLDNRFLYFATREKDFWPRRGGAQPFIPQGDARNCSIPLPPICLQRKFVEIAEQADKSEYYN